MSALLAAPDMLDLLSAVRLGPDELSEPLAPGSVSAAPRPPHSVPVDADLAGPRLTRNTLAPWEEEEEEEAAAAASAPDSLPRASSESIPASRSRHRTRPRLLSTATSVASGHASRWRPSLDSLPYIDASSLRSKLRASIPKRTTSYPAPVLPPSPGEPPSHLASPPSTPSTPFTPSTPASSAWPSGTEDPFAPSKCPRTAGLPTLAARLDRPDTTAGGPAASHSLPAVASPTVISHDGAILTGAESSLCGPSDDPASANRVRRSVEGQSAQSSTSVSVLPHQATTGARKTALAPVIGVLHGFKHNASEAAEHSASNTRGKGLHPKRTLPNIFSQHLHRLPDPPPSSLENPGGCLTNQGHQAVTDAKCSPPRRAGGSVEADSTPTRLENESGDDYLAPDDSAEAASTESRQSRTLLASACPMKGSSRENVTAASPQSARAAERYCGGLEASPHLSLRPMSAMFAPDELAALRQVAGPPPSARYDDGRRRIRGDTLVAFRSDIVSGRTASGGPSFAPRPPTASSGNVQCIHRPPAALHTSDMAPASRSTQRLLHTQEQQHTDFTDGGRPHPCTQAVALTTAAHAGAGAGAGRGADDAASELLSSPERVPSLLHLDKPGDSERVSKDSGSSPPTPTQEEHVPSLVSTRRGRGCSRSSALEQHIHPGKDDIETGAVPVHIVSFGSRPGTTESFHTPVQASIHLLEQQDLHVSPESQSQAQAQDQGSGDIGYQQFLLREKGQLEALIARYASELDFVRARLDRDEQGACPCCGKGWRA